MKTKKMNLVLLTAFVCSMCASSCSSPAPESSAPTGVLDVSLNKKYGIATNDLAVKIMTGIAKKGADMVKGKAIAWGEKICMMVLDSVGLPIFDTDPSELILEKLEKMEEQLKEIQVALSEISTKIDQNEATRILDNFMDKFNELKTSVSPVMAGLATFTDQENQAGSDETKLADLKLQEEEYYKNYVSSLKKSGNSFSERVILLANSIVSPSTNPEYNLLRCFDLSVMDSNPKLQWNTQRIEPKYEFLLYLSSLLLNSLTIARFEIAYQLEKDTSTGGQAMWKAVEKNLDDAITPALNKIQSFFNTTKQEEDAMKSGGSITHVKSNISVSSRLAILSLGDETNVLSYRNTYTSYPAAGGIETGYQRKVLNTPSNLLSVLLTGYKDYLNADSLTSQTFSFYQYLDNIGFYTNGDDSKTIGVWNRAFTEHEGNTFTTEYDYFNVEYIDRVGVHQNNCFGKIVNKVFRKAYYEGNSHLNDKYLVFLEPDAKKVFGSYETIDFLSVSRGNQVMLKEDNFPYQFNYQDAVNDGSLGQVQANW